MRSVVAALFALSALTSGAPTQGAVYHVAPGGDDSGPGSAAQPWATLAKANATLAAGDEVLIHAGTYDDSIRPDADGTGNDDRIVYRAAGDGDVILTGFPGGGGPTEGALALGEKRYVTVSGRAAGDPTTAQRIRLSPQEDHRGVAIGMFDFFVNPVDLGRHVFANNILYGSSSDVTGPLLAAYWDADFPTSDRYVRNVWGRERISGAGPDVGAFEGAAVLFADGFESGDASGWSTSTIPPPPSVPTSF